MTYNRSLVTDTRKPEMLTGRFMQSNYFASNQALIFIGPYLVDEAVAVSYKLEQRKVPIYGYASQYYDKVAAGKVIVSGSITINYIDPAYLFLAMYNQLRKGGSSSYKAVIDSISGANIKGKKIAKALGELIPTNASGDHPINSRTLKEVTQLVVTNPVEAKAMIDGLRERYWGDNSADNSNLSDSAGTSRNITLEQLNSDNEKYFERGIAVRPDNMPPINIVVSHGNPLKKFGSAFRVLVDVDFISVEQTIAPTAQSQLETYSFIAKTIN